MGLAYCATGCLAMIIKIESLSVVNGIMSERYRNYCNRVSNFSLLWLSKRSDSFIPEPSAPTADSIL